MAGVYLKVFVDSIQRYQKLNDAEFGRLMRAAIIYKATGEEVKLTGREDLYWDGIKIDIDRDNETYAKVSKAKSLAGKKGAATRWKSDSICHIDDGKNSTCHFCDGKTWHMLQDKDKDKEEDKEKDKDKDIKEKSISDEIDKKKSSRFAPPTLEEVEKYCLERNNDVDPKRFWDYFNASGWKDSLGKPVRNWKQKVISWEGRQRGKPVNTPSKQAADKPSAPNMEDYERMVRMLDRIKGG